MKYIVTFTLFGKTIRTKIMASSPSEAKEKCRIWIRQQSEKIDPVVEIDNRVDKKFKDLFGDLLK